MLMRKLMSIRYSALESSEIRQMADSAWNVTWSNNHGVEGTLRHLSKAASALFTLCGLALTLGALHPLVPVLLLAISALDQLALRRISAVQTAHYDENKDVDRRLDYVNETMQSSEYGKEIRTTSMKTYLRDWHERLLRQKLSLFDAEKRETARSERLQIVLSVLREALIYGCLAYAVWMRHVSVADFSLYFAAAMRFSSTFVSILTHGERLRLDSRCVEDMRHLMELPDEPRITASFDASKYADCDIAFKDVSYRYPGAAQDALSHFSFTFKAGRCYALVGENGSGKTTLVKLLCGLIEPDSGVIMIGQTNAAELSGAARYSLFSAVFQNINTYAMTLGENVAMSDNVNEPAVRDALNEAGLDISAYPKGLNTMLRRDFDPEGIDLSGGQKQALAVARAVYHEHSLMTVLDEPTAALDPLAEKRVYDHLDQLIDGRTALFISHRLASAQFCDEVLVLEQGCLVEQGTHEMLMKAHGSYARMYEVQNSYYKDDADATAEVEVLAQ